MMRPLVLLACALCVAGLRAHPEIEEALVRLNGEIAASPANPDLYLDRGALYAQHAEWITAEANYLLAAELAPTHPRLARLRGALALSTRDARAAIAFLDTALAHSPRDGEALVLRARAHVALGVRSAAITDLTTALATLATPPPELFLERAALLPAADALRSLDEAIVRIGPAVSLHLRALALEESLGRVDAALARLATLAVQSERQETWLKRRGDLLARAGRHDEARAAYATALAAISALPDWLRTGPDTVQLTSELRQLAASRS